MAWRSDSDRRLAGGAGKSCLQRFANLVAGRSQREWLGKNLHSHFKMSVPDGCVLGVAPYEQHLKRLANGASRVGDLRPFIPPAIPHRLLASRCVRTSFILAGELQRHPYRPECLRSRALVGDSFFRAEIKKAYTAIVAEDYTDAHPILGRRCSRSGIFSRRIRAWRRCPNRPFPFEPNSREAARECRGVSQRARVATTGDQHPFGSSFPTKPKRAQGKSVPDPGASADISTEEFA
jgi:hypothetical protein